LKYTAGIFGKTTLALNAVAQAQAAGGTAAFIDAEHALDVNYAKRIGVNMKTCLFHSLIQVNRHWRLQSPWSEAVPWTL